MSGLVDKKVGFLIYKARTLVLNDSDRPKLTYFDPSTNAKKVTVLYHKEIQGEIELTDKISIEMEKNGFMIDVP
jgi:3-phosphoinositide dependent protein kinase-1